MINPFSPTTTVLQQIYPDDKLGVLYIPEAKLAIDALNGIFEYTVARPNPLKVRKIIIYCELMWRIQDIYNKTKDLKAIQERYIEPKLAYNEKNHNQETEAYFCHDKWRYLYLPSINLAVKFGSNLIFRFDSDILRQLPNSALVTVPSYYPNFIKEMYDKQEDLENLKDVYYRPFLRIVWYNKSKL